MIQAPTVQNPAPAATLLDQLSALGWVDRTALAVLLVFFVLGLFKGLIWQVSRIGILVAAYVVAGRFGHDVAGMLAGGPPADPAAPAAAVDAGPGESTLYLAYVLLFLAVLVVLSLVAMLVKRLADKAGLGFFDRLGGGLLGIATGACVVLALVFVVHMFFKDSELARAAESSHSLRWSQRAIDWLGSAVDDDLRSVLELVPLQSGEATPGAPRAPGDPTAPGVPPAAGAAPSPVAPAPTGPQRSLPDHSTPNAPAPSPDANGGQPPSPPPPAPPRVPGGDRGGER